MVLAKKKNMTQLFDENNQVVPVTILDYSECFVAEGQKKSGKFIGIGKKANPNKPETGKFGEQVPQYSIKTEDEINEVETLNAGDVVNVSSLSKGKGFAGVVKRHGFKGGKRTHGQSDRQRHPGSIGAGTTPGRVFKGKRMGGRMGYENVTLRGLRVISVDTENKIICIKGSVPGTYDTIVEINKSIRSSK